MPTNHWASLEAVVSHTIPWAHLLFCAEIFEPLLLFFLLSTLNDSISQKGRNSIEKTIFSPWNRGRDLSGEYSCHFFNLSWFFKRWSPLEMLICTKSKQASSSVMIFISEDPCTSCAVSMCSEAGESLPFSSQRFNLLRKLLNKEPIHEDWLGVGGK